MTSIPFAGSLPYIDQVRFVSAATEVDSTMHHSWVGFERAYGISIDIPKSACGDEGHGLSRQPTWTTDCYVGMSDFITMADRLAA